MLNNKSFVSFVMLSLLAVTLSSCSNFTAPNYGRYTVAGRMQQTYPTANYASRLPQSYSTGGVKTIVVDPNVHAWGAYSANGTLVRAGVAVAGASYCPDIHRGCKTRAGHFRISSLGSSSCKSHLYPRPRGGAPMPYCMFFNGSQGLHGSYPGSIAEANLSHGCVRMTIPDAEWVRFNFASVGTRVVVRPY